MPLWAFAKLFPNQLTKTRMPTGLWKCNTKLRAYNRTNIPQLSALDTTITWKDKETKKVNKMDTTFYITDTPGLAFLGLPSCSRLRIVNLNYSVQLGKHGQPIKTCKWKSQTGYEAPQANQLQRWSNQGLPKPIWRNWEIPRYLPHISQRGCHTCCAHILEMPNSHKTPGRQEAGQTLGARNHCAGDRTNRLGIIISLLMESRQWPKDMP